MIMNKIIRSLLLAGLVTGSASVNAESYVSWIPTNGLSYKTLEYGVGSASVNASFMSMNMGLVAAFDSFYMSLELDQALNNGEFDGGQGFEGSSDVMNLTIGCNCLSFAPDLTLFAGYTSIDTVVDGGVAFQEVATDAGFFVGGSHSLLTTNTGQLTASLAYAALDGESIGKLSSGNISFLGDTTGISYGVTWVSSLADNVNYSITAKVNDYTFDLNRAVSASGSSSASGSRARVFTILGAKVTYFF